MERKVGSKGRVEFHLDRALQRQPWQDQDAPVASAALLDEK